MGWNEPKRPDPGSVLADAVRAWRTKPSTANAEKVSKALDDWDDAQDRSTRVCPGSVRVHIDAPPPERTVIVVPVETGRRYGW